MDQGLCDANSWSNSSKANSARGGGGLIVDLIVDLIVQKLISVEGERPNSDLIVQKLIARGGGGYKS